MELKGRVIPVLRRYRDGKGLVDVPSKHNGITDPFPIYTTSLATSSSDGRPQRSLAGPNSPFQFEVGTASLGFAVVVFLAAWRSFDLRLAAVIGPSIFTLGAAVGHVQQMIASHNFAPGNAGVIFYTDIAIPLVGLVLLWLQGRVNREPTRAIPA